MKLRLQKNGIKNLLKIKFKTIFLKKIYKIK